MGNYDQILQANASYAASFGARANLAMPPKRHIAVLTCMDARLQPGRFASFEEGDAHVIRNAGGRASDDAIRSLVISYKLLGTREFYVIHHTDCGMLTFTNDQLRDMLKRDTSSDEASRIDFLPFADLTASVEDDVKRIRAHPLIPAGIPIYGFVFDVKTGRLEEVAAASKAGRATATARGG